MVMMMLLAAFAAEAAASHYPKRVWVRVINRKYLGRSQENLWGIEA